MLNLSVAAPASIGASSAVIGTFLLDPKTAVLRAGAGLGPTDAFAVYGLMSPSVGVNARLIGTVRGNSSGTSYPAISLQGYPFFLLTRLTGGGTGNIFASGSSGENGAASFCGVAPPSATVGSTASFSLAADQGEALVGLSSVFTSADVFNVYGTNDSSATVTNGAVFLGTIQGGGTVTVGGVTYDNITTLRVNAKGQDSYSILIVQRVGGTTTSGIVLAFGATTPGSNGLPGLVQPTGLVPQSVVDGNTYILMQGTGAVTLSPPSSLEPSMRVIVNVGTTSFTLYGMTVQGSTVSPQHASAELIFDSQNYVWTLVGNT